MTDKGSAEREDVPQQDLSVPMWVWTLIGFALVTAVLIILIIRGGAAEDSTPAPGVDGMDVPAETHPTETRPAEEIQTR